MAVNKNIWLTKNNLTVNKATYEYSKSISELFSAGKLILNSDFDKTIYMWDREPFVYNFYRLDQEKNPEICATNKDSRTAVTLCYAEYDNGYFPVGFPSTIDEKSPLTYAMRPDQKEDTRPKYGSVITNFDYKTIVFCIYVKCTSDTYPYSIQTIPLKTYFDSKQTQKKKKIKQKNKKKI